MNERLIFPGLKLFKKTVVEHFLVATREIYKRHPAYLYKENAPEETRIHIEPTYANMKYGGKVPQLLVKVGNYEFALQDTFGNNMFEEVINELNVIGGYRSLKDMSAPITILVRAYAEEESQDIADEFIQLAVYAASHMYNQVGINVRGASVSDTREVDQQSDFFETIINLQVNIPWQFSNVSGKEAVDPGVDVELPEMPEGYRAPNVYIYEENEE